MDNHGKRAEIPRNLSPLYISKQILQLDVFSFTIVSVDDIICFAFLRVDVNLQILDTSDLVSLVLICLLDQRYNLASLNLLAIKLKVYFLYTRLSLLCCRLSSTLLWLSFLNCCLLWCLSLLYRSYLLCCLWCLCLLYCCCICCLCRRSCRLSLLCCYRCKCCCCVLSKPCGSGFGGVILCESYQ